MAAFSTTQKNFLPQMKEDFSLLCKILGILENDEKDEEGTLIKLLGRLVDSTSFTVSIPQDKVQQVIALTANALNKKSITLHEAQSLVGLVTFCASAVQLGFVFCRRLWSFVASYKPEWNKAYRRRVPAPVQDDILWWHNLFPAHNGIRFFDDSNRKIVHLFADALVLGIGAFYFDDINTTFCDWKLHTLRLPYDHALASPLPSYSANDPFDINIYEITALLQAFQLWVDRLAGKIVFIHTDSSTAQLGLLKQTLRTPEQNEPLRQLLLLAAQRDTKIEAIHIPGEENGLADALSHNRQDYIANWCPHWQKSYHSLRRQ